jgi:hypothetical protein
MGATVIPQLPKVVPDTKLLTDYHIDDATKYVLGNSCNGFGFASDSVIETSLV